MEVEIKGSWVRRVDDDEEKEEVRIVMMRRRRRINLLECEMREGNIYLLFLRLLLVFVVVCPFHLAISASFLSFNKIKCRNIHEGLGRFID